MVSISIDKPKYVTAFEGFNRQGQYIMNIDEFQIRLIIHYCL